MGEDETITDFKPLEPAMVDRIDSQSDHHLRLGQLPVGGRVVVRCSKDWRQATVITCRSDVIVLLVSAPSGRTYRIRRPSDSVLSFVGAIPLAGEGPWRPFIARYDFRW